MFGFEITSDLLIVAIFAQTIVISLIIITFYFKIKNIQYKTIDLNEKLEEKLDRVESKLSYLSNQVLVISANRDKFKYPTSSLHPSTYSRTNGTTHEDLDSQNLLRDLTLYAQNSRDFKKVDTRLTGIANPAATKAEDSETKPIQAIEAPLFSRPKTESTDTTTSSSSSSITPENNSFSEKSKSNKPGDAASKDLSTDFVQNNDGSASTNRFDHKDHIEKNTNPEIDKIEKEILIALKRLGGNVDDFGDLDGYDSGGGGSRKEEVLYPAIKKSDRKVKNFD
ncbi:MAG TPA: hypothetical protein VJP58_06000 [Candidatus Nitrosocosmicus sp.]|nr:hypothetical protein [Candidatus Nitrosocosmicus sp.]